MDPVAWTHRTKTGRVVYNRKKHIFTYVDAFRIVRKMRPWRNPPGVKRPLWLGWFLQLLHRLLRHLFEYFEGFDLTRGTEEEFQVLTAWHPLLTDLLAVLASYTLDPDLGVVAPDITLAAAEETETEEA